MSERKRTEEPLIPTEQDAYQMGVDAWHDEVDESKNPFDDVNDPRHASWNDGWISADESEA